MLTYVAIAYYPDEIKRMDTFLSSISTGIPAFPVIFGTEISAEIRAQKSLFDLIRVVHRSDLVLYCPIWRHCDTSLSLGKISLPYVLVDWNRSVVQGSPAESKTQESSAEAPDQESANTLTVSTVHLNDLPSLVANEYLEHGCNSSWKKLLTLQYHRKRWKVPNFFL